MTSPANLTVILDGITKIEASGLTDPLYNPETRTLKISIINIHGGFIHGNSSGITPADRDLIPGTGQH